MLSIFSCASWPAVYLLWRNVCIGFCSFFLLGVLVIELHELLFLFWKLYPLAWGSELHQYPEKGHSSWRQKILWSIKCGCCSQGTTRKQISLNLHDRGREWQEMGWKGTQGPDYHIKERHPVVSLCWFLNYEPAPDGWVPAWVPLGLHWASSRTFQRLAVWAAQKDP